MRFLAAVMGAALLLFASVSLAQPKAAVPPADDVEAAKAHFAAGSAYYEQANYTDAVKEFNEAYRLSHRTDLLYNIALCYERLNQYDEAIGTLQKYLAEKPDAPDHVTIESRIANLQHLREQAQKPQTPAVVTPPQQPVVPTTTAPLPRKRLWWLPGVIVEGAAAVVLVTALGTGIDALAIHNSVANVCKNNVCPASERNTVNLGQALAITTDVLIPVGAAAAMVGAIVLGLQSRRPHASHARIVPTPTGLSVRF